MELDGARQTVSGVGVTGAARSQAEAQERTGPVGLDHEGEAGAGDKTAESRWV